MTDLPERPALTLIVQGEEIKMTYGLEMDLRRMLPDAQSTITVLQNDAMTIDYVIRRVMTPVRKLIMSADELIPAEQLDLEPEDVQNILDWVTEHSLYFFVKRAKMMESLGARYQGTLPSPSTTGSPA